MKILLDECIPRKLKPSFVAHDCQTVPEAGLEGKKNGELLSIAEGKGFEVFLTLDKGIEFQQNLSGHRTAVIILKAKSNRVADLIPLVQDCITKLRSMRPGQILTIGE